MNITKKQMDEINQVQLKMFKEFVTVCNKLKLKYFLVHGSLLGAVRYDGFFPYDDDIDVAMPRKDYEILMDKGQELFSDNLFFQCNKTEGEYPLVFGKLRNSNTAFIQPVLDGLKINKGIYIDIFPIDNYPVKRFTVFKKNLLGKLYRVRLSSMFNTKKSMLNIIVSRMLKILMPNKKKTLMKLNNLYSDVPMTGKGILYGGKLIEKGIDISLFDESCELTFEKITAKGPKRYIDYLNLIYGDYKTFSPSEKYMQDNDLVEISAKIVDTKKSYKEYD